MKMDRYSRMENDRKRVNIRNRRGFGPSIFLQNNFYITVDIYIKV